MPMPCAESFRGSTSMRTAYFCGAEHAAPARRRSPSRCAATTLESAYSLTVESGSVGDRSDEEHDRLVAGIHLLYDGGDGICGGS